MDFKEYQQLLVNKTIPGCLKQLHIIASCLDAIDDYPTEVAANAIALLRITVREQIVVYSNWLAVIKSDLNKEK